MTRSTNRAITIVVVAAIRGPLIATRSLAWGSLHRFDGAAFLVAGGLIGAAALIIATTVRPTAPAPAGG